MIRIVLLDPHPVAQKGFKAFFKKTDHIEVVQTFSKVEQLFDFLNEEKVDIVFTEM